MGISRGEEEHGMKIAILGGTGQLGRRLAEGWSRAGHTVTLGSRHPSATAVQVAEWEYPCPVTSHLDALQDAELVVFSTPAGAVDTVAQDVAPHLPPNAVILSVMVPLSPGEPTRYAGLPEGSLAQHLASLLPEGSRVVAGFHTVSAQPDWEDGDVLICGGGKDAQACIAALVEDLKMRPIDCGPLRMAEILERLTPLLIGINRRYHVHGAGIRVTGLP